MRSAAVDQGTTSTKAAVLVEGGLRKIAQHRHGATHPHDGWVEHDPEELLAHVRASFGALAREGATRCGLANQGETVVAWDAKTGEPIYPAIVWQDARTQPEIERLRAEGAEELTLARAGLPLDPYFSASKLAWIVRHVDRAGKLAREGRLRLGTSDAYFLDRLCGRAATDPTTASRTSLLDIRAGAWDPALCELFGVPIEALPEIVPTNGWFGDVDTEHGTVAVHASVVDQQGALHGHGCRAPGDTKITFGTGAFVLTVVGETFPTEIATGVLPTIGWQRAGAPTVYALDGGVYDAGSVIEWLQRVGLLGSVEELDTLPDDPAVDHGVIFVPALSGLACPFWDRSATGTWLGITHGTSREDLLRSALEGVVLLTALVVRTMGDRLASAGAVSVDGGLVRSERVCRFLASALGRPVRVPDEPELTLLGAAILAAESDGMPEIPGRSFEPGTEDVARWHERFADAVSRATGWRREQG
jgi:glycerol kinase